MKQFDRLVYSIEKIVFWFVLASVCLTIGTPNSAVIACVVMALPFVIIGCVALIKLVLPLTEED